ncbi:MAG: ATP-binding protein [Acidimicrobiales bacterium]
MPVETIDVVVTSDNAVVPRVRFLSRQVGAVLGCRIDVDLVALLTTEVLSNAVRQAAGPVVAVFSLPTPDRLRVEVGDRSSATPRVLHPDPLDDGGHRGLMVVEKLATAWGVDQRPGGKVVWFEVSAAPPFDAVTTRATSTTTPDEGTTTEETATSSPAAGGAPRRRRPAHSSSPPGPPVGQARLEPVRTSAGHRPT